jgi:dCTP deaminase
VVPFSDVMVQPGSLDVRLGDSYMTGHALARTDRSEQIHWTARKLAPGEALRIRRGEFILAQTLERVRLSRWLLARLCGRSSWGRQGLMIHVTAGVIDPGWDGVLTLEMYNVGPATVEVPHGAAIGQLIIERLDSESTGYRGRYQGAQGVEASKL